MSPARAVVGLRKRERGGQLGAGSRGVGHQIDALVDARNAAVGLRGGCDLGNVERAVGQHQPLVVGSIGFPIGGNHDLAHVLGGVKAGLRSELLELGVIHRQMREHILAKERTFGLGDLEPGNHLGVGQNHLQEGRIGGEGAQGKG